MDNTNTCKHWILGVIHLKERRVAVFDSLNIRDVIETWQRILQFWIDMPVFQRTLVLPRVISSSPLKQWGSESYDDDDDYEFSGFISVPALPFRHYTMHKDARAH